MSILKFHGIRGLTKRGDTPRYIENEAEACTTEEPDMRLASLSIVFCSPSEAFK
jgi:hypothetical protein